MAQSLNDQDVYLYRSSDPHTAIPDWLPRCSLVSPEARFMAVTILVLSKAPMPPTRAEIAESMGVDIRTVQRWLGELRSAGLLSEHQVGRRVLCVFERPMDDRGVMGDRGVTRHTDHPTHGSPDTRITHDPQHGDQLSEHQTAPNGAFFENSIGDPPVGVVGVQHDPLIDPTAATRAPLKTALGRWLKQAGMNAARDFDSEDLDFETYRRWVLDKRDRGWDWRQIVSTLREAPLVREEHMAPALADAGADLADAGADLVGDLAEISARRELLRQEMIQQLNNRPNTYHGGGK